jgi:minor extracellular serine protease Vpr
VLRRLLVLVAALSLLVPSAALARDPSAAEQFQPTPIQGSVDPQLLPLSLDDSRTITVMLELRGDPVAVVESRAPNKELTKAQRDAIKAELKARQDAIVGEIANRGGRVLSQLQSAYNGIKVHIARKDAAGLAALPNVIAVRGLQLQTIENASSVPYIGVPVGVWQNLGITGASVKVAVIDTGIDYTHANFGGPGTPEAYDVADAADTTLGDAGDAGIFGPAGTSKVKGGHDFVGDDYDASADPGDAALIPHPDPDPLDCNGHGSHVAGTSAGFGVLSTGVTYGGPYDSTTHANTFNVGPGVAPEADLYALRVFGCLGSTNVTVDAIDWAVDNDMDVINMSLGSPFGRRSDPSAVASTNAAAAGVIVVTSAGNSGTNPYITGSPGTGTGAISTAAVDSVQTFPGVILSLSTGTSVTALSANGVAPPNGTVYNVVVLEDDPATPLPENEALGCSVDAFTKAGITTNPADPPTLAVTVRGTCARVARAVFGQQAGADAVAMINTDAGYPPFEGPITGNPDTGEDFEVTIPFLGVRGVLGPNPTADGDNLVAADTGTATTTTTTITNPGFQGFAGFSSGGPTNGDSFLKPDVAAPGVSIASTGMGTGTKAAVISGTSMSSPHVAGVAALVREAHPAWTVEEVKAAITNSGSQTSFPAGSPYRVTRAGSGLVTPSEAVGTSVVALGDMVAADPAVGLAAFHNSNLSFGFSELQGNYSQTRTITIRNYGSEAVTLTPSAVPSPQSGGASVVFGAGSINVPGNGGQQTLNVTLNVPAATAGNSVPTGANPLAFREVSGNVELNGSGVSMRVPYLLVPRPLSKLSSTMSGQLNPNGEPRTVTTTNVGGMITGFADYYQWGLQDGNDVNEAVLGGAGYDLRSVGVQAFPFNATNQLIVFAVNAHDRWSTAAVNEYDILVNTDDDAAAEFAVVGVDFGAVTAGSFNGRVGAFVFNLATDTATINFFASAPSDSSTLLLPILSSQLGLTAADGNFEYQAVSFSLEGPGADPMKGKAGFNPWTPALRGAPSNFPFYGVAPGGSGSGELFIDAAAYDTQKMLGVMITTFDNASGAGEAQLINAPGNKKAP